MFFDSWEDLLRVLVMGVLGYVALIVVLRISGKRTLSKMNAFDFVITVAIGSAFANVLLDRDVTLAEGVLALSLLVFLQYAITWLSTRSEWVADVVKSQPALLFYRGGFLADALRRQRITASEVCSAIRESGTASLDDVEAVVLETTGTLSVIRRSPGGARDAGALQGVAGASD